MNDIGRQHAEQLAQKEYSPIEYRNRLVRMQNMDCVCHCSAEIDMGTLLYFSVNDFYLGQGCFALILFSEISESSAAQHEGRDVFSRMFTYAVVEEVAVEVFTGHYAFYASQLDGRLALLLNFPFGLLPDRGIFDYLSENCREVSRRCRSRFDMDVVAYIGEPLEDMHYMSAVYSKLLETATLHRYTRRVFDDPVFHIRLPAPMRHVNTVIPSPSDAARRLLGCLLGGGDYHAEADRHLDALAAIQPNSVDSLKRQFGDYFEALCAAAGEAGLKLQTEALRDAQFHMIFDSVHWLEPVQWLHTLLDELRKSSLESVQKAARLRFGAALRYIEANLCDPGLTPERCAAAAQCSVSALNKAFRRQLGSSIARHIRAQRLELAMRLLKEGSPVGTVCETCGFGSAETFHRAFKAEFGVTPGRMRGAGQGSA